jgi:hypothetical protein
MRRTGRLALGAVVVLAASFAMAQGPATEYYPLKPNSKWVYKVGETTITVRVASVDKDGSATLETLVNEKAQPVASEVIQVKADGVYRTKINKNDIKEPVKILELKNGKIEKGLKWKVDSKIADQAIKGEFSITNDKEKVKVAAGEFDAVVVDGPEFDIAGTKTSVKYWFVAGKGVVKLTYGIGGSDATLELKEYVEGK